jgi:hypothetical protein
MIQCDDPSSMQSTPGYHECLLIASAAAFRNFSCPPAPAQCAAVLFEFRDNTNRDLCDIKDMSITIDGKLLPVELHTTGNNWRMILKEPPPHDAVAHWTIVPCGAPL